MARVTRETVVVGIDSAGSVLCMREQVAYAFARLNAALNQSETWGEFFRLISPETREDILRRMSSLRAALPRDADRFDPMSIPGYRDGTWPTHPAYDMLDWIPETVLSLGRWTTRLLEGERFEIHASRLPDVVVALERAGYRVKRDTGPG